MNITFTMTKSGKSLSQMIEDTKLIEIDIKNRVKSLAEESAESMKSLIEEGRKRADSPRNKPKLSDLIDTEVTQDIVGYLEVGVGNIEKIESLHRDSNNPTDSGKGWVMLEFGGKIPGGGKNPSGQFSNGPAGSSVGNRFQYKQGSGRMFPKTVMQGIHFISRTFANISLKINTVLGVTPKI